MINKKALITGATSGIGLAFAERFASMNYDLVLTGTRGELESIGKTLSDRYNITVKTIIKKIEFEKDIDYLIKSLDGINIDALINNAGFAVKGPFFGKHVSKYLAMINLHVILTARLTHHCIQHMLDADNGIIINVSSDAAYLCMPGNAVYSGTKAFIKQFTECLYLDVRKKSRKIKVMVLCPGFTRTDFHEKIRIPKERQVSHGLIRWSTPEEVVAKGMNDLNKGKVISITGGISTRVQILMYKLLPKNIFYKIVSEMF